MVAGRAPLSLAVGIHMKTIQLMLGHCSHKLTAATYTSVLPQLEQKAAGRARGGRPARGSTSTARMGARRRVLRPSRTSYLRPPKRSPPRSQALGHSGLAEGSHTFGIHAAASLGLTLVPRGMKAALIYQHSDEERREEVAAGLDATVRKARAAAAREAVVKRSGTDLVRGE